MERLPRKHPWWSHFCIKKPKNLQKKDSTIGAYPEKFLKTGDFWQLLLNSLRQLLLVYFNISPSQQFLLDIIFYNVTLNVNKKFLQITLLLTPYRINMTVSFLEDLTQIIFNDSLKQNEQLASTAGTITAKIVYYKISCTRKTYSVGQADFFYF